jgi:hypothetical protein
MGECDRNLLILAVLNVILKIRTFAAHLFATSDAHRLNVMLKLHNTVNYCGLLECDRV